METILIVDDEPTLLDTLKYNLVKAGYNVRTAEDGLEALQTARAARPNLILLDLMLPGLDGIEVCRLLRRESDVPIIMLTARDEEIDKVVGLELGADDYVTKPFSLRELLARIKALLRRNEAARTRTEVKNEPISPKGSILRVANLNIDTNQHRATRDGMELNLKPREFELLAFLMLNQGQVFSREQLLDKVWGYEYVGDSRTVDVHVRWLREKIEVDPSDPHLLETVRGVGYRLNSNGKLTNSSFAAASICATHTIPSPATTPAPACHPSNPLAICSGDRTHAAVAARSCVAAPAAPADRGCVPRRRCSSAAWHGTAPRSHSCSG